MRWAERDRSGGGERYSRLTRASKAGLHSFSLSKLIGRKLSGPVWRVGERSRWRKRDGCRLKFREERKEERRRTRIGAEKQESKRERTKMDEKPKEWTRKGGPSGDSSASTRHYAAAGTNLYKGKTKTLRKVNRAAEREGDLGGIIQAKESHPNWKPATVSTGCTAARIRVFRRGLRGIRNRNCSKEWSK